MQRSLIWVGIIIGSILGSQLASLLGFGIFSFMAMLIRSAGAGVGIWAGFKLGANI